MTYELHRDYNLTMSGVEDVRSELVGLHNQALDFLGGKILGLYGVKVEEPEAMKGALQVETATEPSTTETRPPNIKEINPTG